MVPNVEVITLPVTSITNVNNGQQGRRQRQGSRQPIRGEHVIYVTRQPALPDR